MIVPVGPEGWGQELLQIDRLHSNPVTQTTIGRTEKFDQSDFSIKPLMDVQYVPLIKPPN
jgi:hypothetical protein